LLQRAVLQGSGLATGALEFQEGNAPFGYEHPIRHASVSGGGKLEAEDIHLFAVGSELPLHVSL
jgi:hypothetical protein